MVREVILATRNVHKGAEMRALLADLGFRVRTLAEFSNVPEVIEDGETCEANAVKKATTVASSTGMIAVADDTGLEVDALDGRPGVYAARYAGEAATYQDNCDKLLRELTGVPAERRAARFITVVAVATPSKQVQTVKGILEGRIAEVPAGREGFGYDPVFFVPSAGKTLAELTPDEKNTISHRAKAFEKAKDLLRQLVDRAEHVGA